LGVSVRPNHCGDEEIPRMDFDMVVVEGTPQRT
jgi:hypothetical protein